MTDQVINCKLLLIGNSSVGKSSLLLRFTDKQWLPEDEASATIGVDFRICKMDVKGKKVKLSLWDTAGQERFRTITASYYRGAEGVILVYDVSNRDSFDALPKWFTELETYVGSSVVKMIVGNKLDKEFSRAVSETEGRRFAESQGCLFVEASAKTNVGVREAFLEVVEQILTARESAAKPTPTATASGPVTQKANNVTTSQNMPGTISLGESTPEEYSACNC